MNIPLLLFLYITPIIISIIAVICILLSTALRKEAGFNTVGDLITWWFCTLIPVFNIYRLCWEQNSSKNLE